MSEEKCYTVEKDGTHTLAFPNRQGLTEDEIEEIFSEFGSVVSVRCAGDERGFRFVRFQTLEEAEAAIQGLQGNPKIKIVPRRPKNPSNDLNSSFNKGSSNFNQNQKNGPRNDPNFGGPKNFRNNNVPVWDTDKVGNNGFKNENESRTERPYDNQSGYRPKFQNNNQKFNTRGHKANDNASDAGSLCSQSSNRTSEVDIKFNKVVVNEQVNNTSKLMKLRHSRGVVANTFVPNRSSSPVSVQSSAKSEERPTEKAIKQGPNSGSVHSNESPKVTSEDTLDSSKSIKNENLGLPTDEPPELISSEELLSRNLKNGPPCNEKVKILPAEEVTVANVHENFGVLYVLHLLEKFEPIAVTDMMIAPKYGIRYCTVYFTSKKDAITVERLFDNFELSGKKLLVLTSDTITAALHEA